MSVRVTGVRFNNEFRTAQDLEYLIGCIGEKVTVEIDLDFEDMVFSSSSQGIFLDPPRHVINIQDNVGIFYSENPVAFQNYNVGDTVGFYTASIADYRYNTVTEIIDAQTIRTTYASGNSTFAPNTDFIFNATPFKGLRYLYNLIPQGGNFNSLIDGEPQEGQLETLDVDTLTNQDLVLLGLKSWQIGTIEAKGTGGFRKNKVGAVSGEYERQTFTLTHNTRITPLFLFDQFNDLLGGVKPAYFTAGANLNYIAEISLGRDLTNPNGLQQLTVQTSQSNTGWFDERFNGGSTNYSISSLVLTDVLAATTIPQLEFTKEISVEITIDNTTDTPFSDTNTQFSFGFNYLPEDEALYQGNGFDQTRNFAIDSKLTTIGTGTVNGDNFGTALQIIKTVEGTFISSSQMKITAIIETGADANTILQQGDFERYQFWVITENHALADTLSDKVNLLSSVNEFFVQLIDTSLIQSNGNNFIAHPFTDKADAIEGVDYNVFPVDDIVANLDYHIDFTSIDPDENVRITNIQSKIVARHSLGTEADMLLEEFNAAMGAFPVIGGEAQNINFSQDRVFKIPAEIRKTITAIREFNDDVGSDRFYNYQYPFMYRWEFWEALTGVLNPSSDVFDPDLPNDGINNFWHRLTTITNWDIFYETVFTIEQNSIEFSQTFSTIIQNSRDFEGNAEWDNHLIESLDIDTGLPVENGGIKYVRGYEDVKIAFQCEKVSGTIPALSDVIIVIWIETFEEGGISDIRRISSIYEISSNSWFKSTDSSNKVVVTTPSAGVFRGECLLDNTKIPSNTKFTVYGRLYEKTGTSYVFQDSVNYEFQDASQYDFQ